MNISIGNYDVELYISDIRQADEEVAVRIRRGEYLGYSEINKDNAIEIIEHLKKVFELDEE